MEAPGTEGTAHMSSAAANEGEVHVPPWVSAIDPSPEDDSTVPILWSTLGAKLEEASYFWAAH